jgi:preprotein translocase subunit SecG
MDIALTILKWLVIVDAAAMAYVTLRLNTKSEGLGAAITGASDSYRGAVGIEEQKRHLLGTLCWSMLGICFVYAFVEAAHV